jgi:hypothetical protein
MDFRADLQPFASHDEARRVRAPVVINFPHVREFPDDWFVPATTITYSALVHADRRFSKERYVTTKDANDDVGTRHVRSPIAAGLLSLGIYIAMYLAVAGVFHVLTPPDAVAIAPNGASAATASKPPVDTANFPSGRSSESSADGYAMHRTQ